MTDDQKKTTEWDGLLDPPVEKARPIPTTAQVRAAYVGHASETDKVRGDDFDAWLAKLAPVHENLQIVNNYLVERGVHPGDYPAGPEYGMMPYSDSEPLTYLPGVSGWSELQNRVACDWADYFENHTQTVGAEPLTVEKMIEMLRGPKPFGIAEGSPS